MLDLDHLKAINDRHGHCWGDSLLKELARHAREATGAQGLVARIGGDEFVVLLPGADLDAATAFGRSLRNRLAQAHAAGAHPVSISLGVAGCLHEDDLESVLAQADTAMYADKARHDRPSAREFVQATTP